MTEPPELVLLTAAFPFGNKAEPFLETEIEVLAERFRRIYVLPSHRDRGARPLPANAELVEMDWLDEPTRDAKRRALSSGEAAWVLGATLRRVSNLPPYLRASHTYLDILAKNLLKRRSLANFVRDRRLANAIFYDYWFENSTLALALLRRSGAVATAVSRAHRFDLYDESWRGGRVPFREAKAAGLDRVFAVSGFGAAYLEERLPKLREKLRIERLGVRDPGRKGPGPAGASPLIVTCGNLLPRKRIHLVPELLERLGHPIRWFHLGDGPDRGRVEAAASRLSNAVEWELRGHLDNREVLRFYEHHHVDLFLSLSESEGLPASMMEAQSYGIPIAACGVGGVSEIVTDSTGVLLSPRATPAELVAELRAALHRDRFNREAVRGFFRDHFEAGANYNRFADALIALFEGKAAAA